MPTAIHIIEVDNFNMESLIIPLSIISFVKCKYTQSQEIRTETLEIFYNSNRKSTVVESKGDIVFRIVNDNGPEAVIETNDLKEFEEAYMAEVCNYEYVQELTEDQIESANFP